MAKRSLLTLKEAAQALSVHEQTIHNWGRRGIIRLVRLPGSRHRRVPADEVAHLLSQMARPSVSTGGVRLDVPVGEATLVARGQALAARIQEELAISATETSLDEVMYSLRGRTWSSCLHPC